MGKIKDTYVSVSRFLQEGLWLKDTSALPTARRFLFALCRISMLVIRGYTVDKCSLQASALTYISLISLVPILAIMFSVTKGLGVNDQLLRRVDIERIQVEEAGKTRWSYRIISPEEEMRAGEDKPRIVTPLPGTRVSANDLPEPMQKALINIFSYVENTNFATLGAIGSLMLLLGVISAMSKLEGTMNTIWGVQQQRSYFRKCSDYLILILLMVVVLALATSLHTVILSNKFISDLYIRYATVATTINIVLRVTVSALILMAFGAFYAFMPNTQVKFVPAMLGGVVTGMLWFGVQWVYLHLQVGLTRFNTIYGSFAVVPFFLAWLYANWSIILFGAEFSFAIQNHKTIHIEKNSEKASGGILILLAQLMVFEAGKSLRTNKGPWSPVAFGQTLGIPIIVIRRALHVLVDSGLLVRVGEKMMQEETYLPGKDISLLTPGDVEEAFRQFSNLDTRIYMKNLPRSLQTHYTENLANFKKSLSAASFSQLIDEEARK